MCVGVSTPTSFLPSPPPLNLQTVQTPIFRQSPVYIGFSWNPPLKLRFFHEPQKHRIFSSLIPSYLLKVTKFLVKIPQFEFLVTTEQRILVYKLFLSLNISDFSLSFVKKLQPPWKKSPPLSQQPPSKNWGPVKPPPFWKSGRRFNPPPPFLLGALCKCTENKIEQCARHFSGMLAFTLNTNRLNMP